MSRALYSYIKCYKENYITFTLFQYILCSDYHNKNKYGIFCFLSKLYDIMMTEDPYDNKTETIWSDGPSSEFKNKFMVHIINLFSRKYQKKCVISRHLMARVLLMA